MIASLALLSRFLTSQDYSLDLFLVARNERPVQLTDPKTPVELVLKPVLDALAKKMKPFVILDGADCFTENKKGDKPGQFTQKTFNRVNSPIPGTNLPPTVLETTLGGSVYFRPYTHSGFISQGRINTQVGQNSNISIPIQDLNGLEAVAERGTPEEKSGLKDALIVTADSVSFAQNFLNTHAYRFSGICICASGNQTTPNFVTFPGPDVAGHYILNRHNGHWSIKLVELLNQPLSR